MLFTAAVRHSLMYTNMHCPTRHIANLVRIDSTAFYFIFFCQMSQTLWIHELKKKRKKETLSQTRTPPYKKPFSIIRFNHSLQSAGLFVNKHGQYAISTLLVEERAARDAADRRVSKGSRLWFCRQHVALFISMAAELTHSSHTIKIHQSV